MAKVDRQTAEKEFDTFIQDWDIDVETGMDDEETQSSFDTHKNRILRCMQAGKLSYKDEKMVLLRRDGKELTFSVPRGDAYIEMDSTKANESVKKMNKFMGAMTGRPPSEFAIMDGRDLKVCQAITALFIAG